MLTPNSLRSRLTRYCYVSQNPDELSAQLEAALAQVTQVEPILKKVQKAERSGFIPAERLFMDKIQQAVQAGILSAQEMERATHFEELKKNVIRVDEFSFDLKEVV